MKKKLYIIDYYNPLNNTGLNSYIKELKNQIIENNDFLLNIIYVNSNVHNCETIEFIEGIKYIYFPYDITYMWEINEESYKALKFIVEENKETIDIIFHFNWINHAPFATLLKKEIKCKTLLTNHCISWRENVIENYSFFVNINRFFEQKKVLPFFIKNKLFREIYCYNSVDHIITVTKDARRVLKDFFGISEKKITTIYNGVEIKEREIKNKDKLREKYGFHKEEKIILFVGRVIKSKGVVELLQAFEILMQKYPFYKYRLVICGKGDYDLVYEHIKDYSSVVLTGNISKDILYDFYNLADVGVIPSYIEQCSYTLIEMMLNKLPVIVTETGGLAEIINSTKIGLKISIKFSPKKIVFDTKKLANKIYCTVSEEFITKKRVEEAYKRVQKKFTTEKMVKKTLQIYNALLKKSLGEERIEEDLVSVIIPYYNDEKHIERSLQSVLDQSYRNLEIILIDDGSEEELKEILHKTKDKRIKILRNNINEGISYSLNKGIRISRGKYIARLDSDDIMTKDRIKLQVNFLKENKEYMVVGTNHILINEKGDILQYVSYPETNEEIQIFKYFFNPLSHPTVLFKSSEFKDFLYNDDYIFCEDYKLWFEISKKYKIANIPQYTTYYRLNSEGISSKNNKEQIENSIELILNELESLGIEISDEELKIHCAIVTRKIEQYFNTLEKIEKLKIWLEKLFKHLKIEDIDIKEKVLQYCEF